MAPAEKNTRDLLAQREREEVNGCRISGWSSGNEGNLRALLSILQYILGPGSGWQPPVGSNNRSCKFCGCKESLQESHSLCSPGQITTMWCNDPAKVHM
ncbi:hypothetical protein OROGR_006262 [Orobanche gracilis]